jgi:hypothetical protein
MRSGTSKELGDNDLSRRPRKPQESRDVEYDAHTSIAKLEELGVLRA